MADSIRVHEKLDVCRSALEHVAETIRLATDFAGVHRHSRHAKLRGGQAVSLNIAEVNEQRR